LHGRRAQRRSRAAVRPARQRFTLDGRKHDGSLATSRDDTVHRGDLGSIVLSNGAAHADGVVGYTAERFIRPSFAAFVTEASNVSAYQKLDTCGDACRKRCKSAGAVAKNAMG
jgi:hypothetical protein